MLASTSGDIVNYALAIFLIVMGGFLAFVLVKLAGVFGRVASFIGGAEREMMPVINKVGGSVDRVNHQLDKIDPATDSAVDTVVAVDETVRAVSYAVKRPIEKLLGVSAAVTHGFATLRTKRSWKAATASAKEAAARREADFEEEIHQAHQGWTPPTAPKPAPAPSPPVTPASRTATSSPPPVTPSAPPRPSAPASPSSASPAAAPSPSDPAAPSTTTPSPSDPAAPSSSTSPAEPSSAPPSAKPPPSAT
jgi:hypothetical protein